jgi:hypothetical protein
MPSLKAAMQGPLIGLSVADDSLSIQKRPNATQPLQHRPAVFA